MVTKKGDTRMDTALFFIYAQPETMQAYYYSFYHNKKGIPAIFAEKRIWNK